MPTFTHQPDQNRYQAILGDDVVGTLDYSLAGKKLVIESTHTHNDFRGQGIARRLTRHVFDEARTRGLVVDPKCSYAKLFIDQHPEYSDVL
ncbi:hypothetical protein GA0111570_10891 [Raineyella antarctica]|uniref:Uncharacterized protein n=1 Tax=Raineyella antarctica TaxID=1577474 RepID=A0A1G6HBH7_9ACTN|nr:GNAT family N-acetyltransferase [Raineyella antarctica]SDB91620.1 hypothetical protein GA0111570_10891 [Raineyella antarctica]